MEAIKIVMKNNRMKFGDISVKQIKGIAMGMSPAPPIANIFIAIYEKEKILGKFDDCISFLRRFIDDGFDIWIHHPNPTVDEANWEQFKKVLGESGLQWTFSERQSSAIFMDMNIEIEDDKIVTSLYAKPLALHLYIPPTLVTPQDCSRH